MDQRLFARLAARLDREAVVLASVVDTRGAVPRDRGSRMLIGAHHSEFSVGGGLAEARVIAAAQALLAGDATRSEVGIDLSGRDGSSGVCGGLMRIELTRWQGDGDRDRARAIAEALGHGQRVALRLGSAHAPWSETLHPNDRLLIVGAGHCAAALYEMAQPLEFDVWVQDERDSCFAGNQFARAEQLRGGAALLERALQSERDVYAVLLNRQFTADIAALDILCRRPPIFLGMMGSQKRINEVRTALPGHADALAALCAPIGLEIEAQTPHEIAISILAQLIQHRRRHARR